MHVYDLLKSKGTKIVSLTVNEPVVAAVALLAENRIGAVLIMTDDGKIAGILSERDIVRALHEHRDVIFDKRVSDLMTREVVTCSPADEVASIMGMMTAQRFRHVPVLEEGRLVGIISIGDVVKSRIEEAEEEVDALRRYISL